MYCMYVCMCTSRIKYDDDGGHHGMDWSVGGREKSKLNVIY